MNKKVPQSAIHNSSSMLSRSPLAGSTKCGWQVTDTKIVAVGSSIVLVVYYTSYTIGSVISLVVRISSLPLDIFYYYFLSNVIKNILLYLS